MKLLVRCAVMAMLLWPAPARAQQSAGALATVKQPPAMILGDFEDDYRGRFTVSTTEWFQQPRAIYHIVRWVPDEQYLIARNDSVRSGAPGKWTRIDWVTLDGMPPFDWGFCFTAYDAPTEAAALEAGKSVNRAQPKIGCNGFPFSRMKRVPPPASGGAGSPE